MTTSSILSTSFTNTGVDISANNLIRAIDAASASSNQQTGVAQHRERNTRVAQVFPIPVSISGTPIPIQKMFTNAIIIGSFDPQPRLRVGGFAGFVERYLGGPLASFVANTPVVNDDSTASLSGIVGKLREQRKLNNGQALSRITIVSHGSGDNLYLGDEQDYSVREIIGQIMGHGLLKPGGRLVLGGCSIAGNDQASTELTTLAKMFNIVIQASEVPTTLGSVNLAYKTFYPNGKVTRNLGPFAPF